MAKGVLGFGACVMSACSGAAMAAPADGDFGAYRPSFEAARIGRAEAPRIDGDLSDPAWARAAVLDDFYQVEPLVGAPTERTRAYVMYDEENLYVGIHALDTAPETIRARLLERDAHIGNDPAVRVLLDPFNTRRDGYYFAVNPNGARADALAENNNDYRAEWDAIWRADARLTPDGWTAEFAIPFRSISYDASAPSWGFQIVRNVLSKNEWIRWSNIDRTRHTTDLSNVGEMRINAPAQNGLGLDLQAFATGRWARDWTAEPNTGDFDVSVSANAFYRITPSLTGTLTFNTDFSDTPLDERQVNTGRFDLFFPETRDFFLQDAAIFEFGGRAFTGDTNGKPFFSRQIGLAAGAPADIIAGAKLSGQAGPLALGALVTRTSAAGDVAEQTLSVARASIAVLGESRAGFVLTHGDPLGAVENTVAGADFQFRRSNWNGGTLFADFAYLNSWQDGAAHGLFGSEIAFRSETWNFTTRLRDIEDGFDPRLGFVNRDGVRRANVFGWRAFRPQGSFIRYAEIGPWTNLVTDREGDLLDRNWGFWIGGNTNREDFAYFYYENLWTEIREPFAIAGVVPVAPGRYQVEQYEIDSRMADSRALALRARVRWGAAYDGSLFEIEPGVIIRPNKHFALDLGYQYQDFALPAGEVEVHIASLEAKLNFSPRLQVLTQAQYDNISENLSFSSRLRWEPRPDTEILFVLAHSALVQEERFPRDYQSTGTSVTLRVGRTFRM